MSYPYPAPYPPPYQPVPRPPSTSTTGPKVLTFIGIATLVLAIALGVGGAVILKAGMDDADESRRELSSTVDSTAVATIPPGQTETATLDGYTSYTLWLGPDGSTAGTRPVVTDPSGASVTTYVGRYSGMDWESGDSTEAWTFTSKEAGTYTITAAEDGPTLKLVQGVEIDLLLDGFSGAARAFGGGFMIFVALVLGLVGVGLIIGGTVWWSGRSKNARQAVQAGQPTV